MTGFLRSSNLPVRKVFRNASNTSCEAWFRSSGASRSARATIVLLSTPCNAPRIVLKSCKTSGVSACAMTSSASSRPKAAKISARDRARAKWSRDLMIWAQNFSASWSVRCWATSSNKAVPSGVATSSSRVSAASKVPARSSISENWGETPASSGNRRRSEAQNAWIVWIFSPPGVSIARANRVRAWSSGTSELSGTPISDNSVRSSASSIMAHAPSCANRRFCISPAAALV